MDPWSIAAVVGLVYAGQKLSKDSDESPSELLSVKETSCPDKSVNQFYDFYSMDKRNITPDVGRAVGSGLVLPPKCGIPSLQDMKPQLPFGQPVYNLYDREFISNKMNNLQPVERRNVGPGLGVSADVPATGGFQQYFRVLPNNPNEERLVQLPGTNGGPADAVVKNGNGVIGSLTQFPIKLYTYQAAANNGQGQGGALRGQEGRPSHLKTSRPTIRQETGYRAEGDDLQFGAPQYNVYQAYSDNSGPQTTFKQLQRITDNRSKEDRAGNGQRMNVRADPLDAGGLVTNLRREYVTNEPGVPDASRFQQYMNAEFHKLNEFKSTPNPLSTENTLGLARNVLKNNPLAIPALSG